jgi:DNA-binding transcriptional MerR regulator
MSETYKLGELAMASGVNDRTIRYYVTQGLLPPPHRAGREVHYDRDHLERLLEIKRYRAADMSLSKIAAKLDVLPEECTLPEPQAGLTYKVADDVQVWVSSATSPQRRETIRKALADFAEQVQERVLRPTRPPAQSGRMAEVLDSLEIHYSLGENNLIDRNRALRYRGQTLRVYFNKATNRREAYFTLNKNLYRDFQWRHWREVEIENPSESHFAMMPVLDEEKQAFEGLLAYLRERYSDHFQAS